MRDINDKDYSQETVGERMVREMSDIMLEISDMSNHIDRYDSKDAYAAGIDRAFELNQLVWEIDNGSTPEPSMSQAVLVTRMDANNKFGYLLSKFSPLINKYVNEEVNEIGR